MWRAVSECEDEHGWREELGCVKKAVTAVWKLVLPEGLQEGP